MECIAFFFLGGGLLEQRFCPADVFAGIGTVVLVFGAGPFVHAFCVDVVHFFFVWMALYLCCKIIFYFFFQRSGWNCVLNSYVLVVEEAVYNPAWLYVVNSLSLPLPGPAPILVPP